MVLVQLRVKKLEGTMPAGANVGTEVLAFESDGSAKANGHNIPAGIWVVTYPTENVIQLFGPMLLGTLFENKNAA